MTDATKNAFRASGNRNGFVNFTYERADMTLLFRWMNTFVRRAIGFQRGRVFVGILIAHKNPPVVVSVENEQSNAPDAVDRA